MSEENRTDILVCAETARALDAQASAQWGLNPYALVEAAGRACAQALVAYCAVSCAFSVPRVCIALAGKGNNAADALVMLRALVLSGYVPASACSVFIVQASGSSADNNNKTPLSEAIIAVQRLAVPVLAWNPEQAAALAAADLIIDGITGTGLNGPLRGAALEMAEAVNALDRTTHNRPLIVSVDMPSGNFDGWRSGMPMVAADVTLAIEPQKLCLYTPSARPYSGTIVPVGGIFSPSLTGKYSEAELIVWESAAARIPPVSRTAYKYERGLVEIRAGSPGAAGAAQLAARGAQSAGAGLVRLIVDPALYPIIAPNGCGVMVAADETTGEESGRFSPDALLLGPGWGRGSDRMRLLKSCLPLEERGVPLILDADAILLAKDMVFHGNALLTPHPGEFAAYTGLPKDELLANPVPALRRFAAEKKTYILFKSHVLYAASPDGRVGIIDGMNPVLAVGGSGDVLAGFCAAIAARQEKPFDGYACACAAASLLVRAAESDGISGAFIDPAELSGAAAVIAGAAWLPTAALPTAALPEEKKYER